MCGIGTAGTPLVAAVGGRKGSFVHEPGRRRSALPVLSCGLSRHSESQMWVWKGSSSATVRRCGCVLSVRHEHTEAGVSRVMCSRLVCESVWATPSARNTIGMWAQHCYALPRGRESPEGNNQSRQCSHGVCGCCQGRRWCLKSRLVVGHENGHENGGPVIRCAAIGPYGGCRV